MIDRPKNPTIAQVREISQPTSVTGRANAEHWVADLYLRKISPYLTRLLLKTPITANGVTYLMIATGLSISAALLIPGYQGILLALFLSQLQMLWDCCDGEIARWKNTQSPKGVFLDRVAHYLTESLMECEKPNDCYRKRDDQWVSLSIPSRQISHCINCSIGACRDNICF